MEELPVAEEEDEGFPPLHSDFGPAMFLPYVLDLAALGFGSAHITQCLALVVLARRDGALLALPELAMPGEVLARGDAADSTALVGPHLKAEFGAAMLNEASLLQEPPPVRDRSIPAELVDFSTEVFQCMRGMEDASEVMELLAFDYREPLLIPSLVAKALAWARGDLEAVGERIHFSSADEVPMTPIPGEERLSSPVDHPGSGTRSTPRRRATAPRGGGKGGERPPQQGAKTRGLQYRLWHRRWRNSVRPSLHWSIKCRISRRGHQLWRQPQPRPSTERQQ